MDGGPPGGPAPTSTVEGGRSVGGWRPLPPAPQLQLEHQAPRPVAHRLGSWRSSHSLTCCSPEKRCLWEGLVAKGLFLRGHDSGQVSDTTSATWKQNRPLFSKRQKAQPPFGPPKLLSPRSVVVPAAPSSLRGPLNVWSGGTRLCGEVLGSKKMHFHLPASGPHRPLNPCSPGARPGGLSPPLATWEGVPAPDQPTPCAQTCLRAAPPLC